MLQQRYELVVGCEISDRTWRRVRQRLRVGITDDEAELKLVVGLAKLRKVKPYAKFTKEDVQRFLEVESKLFSLECYGFELWEGLLKMNPSPSLRTVYRWGHDIGVPFSMNQYYTADEVRLWVVHVARQTRFKHSPANLIKGKNNGSPNSTARSPKRRNHQR